MIDRFNMILSVLMYANCPRKASVNHLASGKFHTKQFMSGWVRDTLFGVGASALFLDTNQNP